MDVDSPVLTCSPHSRATSSFGADTSALRSSQSSHGLSDHPGALGPQRAAESQNHDALTGALCERCGV